MGVSMHWVACGCPWNKSPTILVSIIWPLIVVSSCTHTPNTGSSYVYACARMMLGALGINPNYSLSAISYNP